DRIRAPRFAKGPEGPCYARRPLGGASFPAVAPYGQTPAERAQMRLIVTEKNNSAKRIAEILSGGAAKADAAYKVPFYRWSDESGEQMTIGLKGHVLNPAFPDGYSNWQETDLHELIDAEIVKEPTDKNVVRAIRKVAKDAEEIVIATDYDREGELVGLEALEQIVEANPAVA